MAENIQNVFDVEEELIFRTTLTVARSGFYRVEVYYNHNNWDAWLKLDVVSEMGERITSVPPLPRKYTQTTMLLHLFAGENRISMAPRYDQPVTISRMVIVDEAPRLDPYVIPSADWFYRAKPRVRRLTVVSYTGAPVKITVGETPIAFELEDKTLYDHANPVETQEPSTYYHLCLHPAALACLPEGEHLLNIHLPEDKVVPYTLNVANEEKDYAFRVVSLDVSHGNCALLRLPNGKNLLIDTGTSRCAEVVIFPYFEEQGITPDYCIISHYHGDHDGSLAAVLEKYPLAKPDIDQVSMLIASADHAKRAEYLSRFGYLDNKMLCRYDRLDKIWDLGGVEVTVLNSKYEQNGIESQLGSRGENEASVSLLLNYKGFRYYHGADNHAPNQQRNLEDFTAAGRLEELQCHYMQANHHFHGDLLPEMIRAINPVAVLVPADQAIYSRSAYMVDYVQGVAEAAYENKRLKDTFVSYTSGTVSALVNSCDDWHYETC